MSFLVFFALKSLNLLDLFYGVRFQALLWPEVSWLPTAPSKKMATTNLGIAGSWVNSGKKSWRKNRSETNKNHQKANQNSALPKKRKHFPSSIFFVCGFSGWLPLRIGSSFHRPKQCGSRFTTGTVWAFDSFEKKRKTPLGWPGVIFFVRWEVTVKNMYTNKQKKSTVKIYHLGFIYWNHDIHL